MRPSRVSSYPSQTARGSQRRGARGGAAEARAAAAPDLSNRALVFDAISSRPTPRAFSTHALLARSLLRVLNTLVNVWVGTRLGGDGARGQAHDRLAGVRTLRRED